MVRQAERGACVGLRVLHFRRLFSTLSEFFIYDPIREMARRGVDTHVLSVMRMNRSMRPFPAHYLVRAPRSFHSPRLLGKLASTLGLSEADRLLWPLERRLLRSKVARIEPDVIHAHFGPDGCLIRPVAEKLGIPLVVTFYGYDVSRLVHQSWKKWQREYLALFESAALLVGISNYLVDRLVDLGASRDKTILLHPGVNLERFAYRDPAADYRGGPVRCLHVGRLTAKKAPLRLLQAFQLAGEKIGDQRLELDVIGDGELADACQEEIGRLAIRDRVRLHGGVPHNRVVEQLGRAHIYTQHCMLAPDGDTEGLGVSFVEASASGLPIVTTRHNGIPDIVLAGQTGLLSPEGDVPAMAENLARLAQQPERWKELGRRGRQHVEAEFSLVNSVDKQVEMLREVAGK